MERYTVSIWDDKDHDGQRDYANATDPADEVTFVASHDLTATRSGVTLVGVPAS
jgi:predicted glutamine amidotransferase